MNVRPKLRRMKCRFWVLALLAAVAAHGQISWQPTRTTTNQPAPPRNSPVRITVEPGKKTDVNSPATGMRVTGTAGGTAAGSGFPADLPSTVALYYHVKLANISPRSLTNLTARWAILWMDDKNAYRLAEGTETCDIAPVRHHEFDTGAISVRATNKSGTAGKVSLLEKASIIGYCIEVLASNEVIATECKPADIYPLVLQLRVPAKR